MKVIINKTTSIDGVSIVNEKKISVDGGEKRYGIIININNCNDAEAVQTAFESSDITSLEVVREDDMGQETRVDFSKYSVLNKVERKLTDSTDILYVYMVAPAETVEPVIVEEAETSAE